MGDELTLRNSRKDFSLRSILLTKMKKLNREKVLVKKK